MPTPLPVTTSLGAFARLRPLLLGRRSSLPAWTREPLLHFVFLGGLLFGIDHLVSARADDPHVIVVDARVDREARQVFHASRGRDPDAKEMTALRAVWLDNEVLYREGLAMQVDRGDDAIRERVIFKALSVVDANTKLPTYDDATLRRWFETHRERYDEPARYTFDEAVLAGDSSESAVRAFVDALDGGLAGDAQAGLRVFRQRPRSNVVQSYGDDCAAALAQSPPGTWRALRSSQGWRAVRLEATTPSRPAAYEALRGVVLQDWTDATLAEQRSAAVRALARKYRVQYAGDVR